METLQGCDFYHSFCFCHLMQQFTLILNIIKAIFEPNLASSDWVFHEQTRWSTSDKEKRNCFYERTKRRSVPACVLALNFLSSQSVFLIRDAGLTKVVLHVLQRGSGNLLKRGQ